MQFRGPDKVKKEKRQASFFRELTRLFRELSLDESRFAVLYPTRLELSPGNGSCHLYFASHEGEDKFVELLEILKLYKPSFRSALAQLWQSRHTPEIIFKYDDSMDNVYRMNVLLDDIKKDTSSSSSL